MAEQKQNIALLFVGIVLVLMPLIFVVSFNQYFKEAELFLRLVASLGGALIGAWLPGMLNIDIPGIKAGGALAVLVLLWQFNPPQLLDAALHPDPVNDKCKGIDISLTPYSAIGHASWCGSSGATRTTRQQAKIERTESCKGYVEDNWAYLDLTQNQLFEQAKFFARENRDDEAFDLIYACECHNPVAQTQLLKERLNVVCYLKKS